MSTKGIAMQRIEKELDEPYKYQYQYCIDSLATVVQQFSAPKILRFEFTLNKTIPSCKLIDYWSAIHITADTVSPKITKLTGRFGIRVVVKSPVHKVNLGNIMKPLLDGIIAALHYHGGGHPIPNNLDDRHIKFLMKRNFSILGERKLVYDYRNGLMWNPADELCTEALLLNEFSPELSHPIITAEIYNIDQ
ncbi:MAG: hypothetical protein P1P82_16445 [Bacteroidales bacterium]|nr:hypothetical protein [Bacteroidales bacterium]MDT8432956.1 hypothetical protein [Bacteroidales bacterium]